MTYKFQLNDAVEFSYQTSKGKGVIKGVATTEMAVIGCVYIVETDYSFGETYPYTSIAVPEIILSLVDD